MNIVNYDGIYFYEDVLYHLDCIDIFIYYIETLKYPKKPIENILKQVKSFDKYCIYYLQKYKKSIFFPYYLAFLSKVTEHKGEIIYYFQEYSEIIELNSENKIHIEERVKYYSKEDISYYSQFVNKDIQKFVLSFPPYIDLIEKCKQEIKNNTELNIMLYKKLYKTFEFDESMINALKEIDFQDDFFPKLKTLSYDDINKILNVFKRIGVYIPDNYKYYLIGDDYFKNWSLMYKNYLLVKFNKNCILPFSGESSLIWNCYIMKENKKVECNLIIRYPENIKKCIVESTRLSIIPLTIRILDYQSGHQNLLIYDKVLNTLENFEPQEIASYMDMKELESNIKKSFEEILDVKNIEYIGPEHFCPIIGPQMLQHLSQRMEKKSEEITGTCQLWSVVYAYYRLRNPDISRNEIINLLMKDIMLKTNPYEYIKKFMVIFIDINEKINKIINKMSDDELSNLLSKDEINDDIIKVYENAKDLDEIV